MVHNAWRAANSGIGQYEKGSPYWHRKYGRPQAARNWEEGSTKINESVVYYYYYYYYYCRLIVPLPQQRNKRPNTQTNNPSTLEGAIHI
jgi:hypothetical protein